MQRYGDFGLNPSNRSLFATLPCDLCSNLRQNSGTTLNPVAGKRKNGKPLAVWDFFRNFAISDRY
jgi:hypothetical protein